MGSRVKIGVLVAALGALLALAPAALARGGGGTGGGGGGSCAQILSFSNTPVYTDSGDAAITTAYTVKQGCVDEHSVAVDLTFHNDSTGFTGIQSTMTPLGTYSYSNTWLSGFGTRYTITLELWSPNGKLQDSQKQTVTALTAPVAPVV